MWDGFWVLSNSRAYGRLPADLQEVLARNLDTAATDQRADVRKLNESLQSEIEKTGMQFNKPDLEPFRAKLREAGFYTRWRDTFGPECWGLLEKYTGQLA
jgi:TRAP-type C4-dicarboxylate transport system substrate-binding protein